MFRGNSSNTAAPSHPVDVPNRLQSCGNLPLEFHAGQVNYNGNKKTCQDEADLKAKILNQNPVSTGLRLSYDDDDERYSFTISESMKAASLLSSLRNDSRREIDQQKEELDKFLRSQDENMMKGLRDINQGQMASVLTALQRTIVKKLQEKDLELEIISRKNKELAESMKQIMAEAQHWCRLAKYNESVTNVLKTNLQQVMQDSNRGKRGLGESDINDAASCSDPNGPGGLTIVKNKMSCRSCKTKGVSVLLMPCRHLCLCRECEGFVSVCPVCQIVIATSFEVYLS